MTRCRSLGKCPPHCSHVSLCHNAPGCAQPVPRRPNPGLASHGADDILVLGLCLPVAYGGVDSFRARSLSLCYTGKAEESARRISGTDRTAWTFVVKASVAGFCDARWRLMLADEAACNSGANWCEWLGGDGSTWAKAG